MSMGLPERKLAAVLFADIVGYSQLMNSDESGTYESWRMVRTEIVEPVVSDHHGRLVKFTGDGFLVEFTSAESAVVCSLSLQEALAQRSKLTLRIGIHLGDVYTENGDLYGDGVNIASRLEGLAEPGGICISGTVHDLVRNRISAAFVDGGPRSLKHISEPIRVWHLRPQKAAPATTAALKNLDLALQRPRIAVLPFTNLSRDPEQEYFADGLADDLITELSRTGALFVVARNSTFAYKGQAIDVIRIARELGVRYVVEGSVRHAGKRIRVNAKLIDGTDGGHLWADRFDRDLNDIFAVQDEITKSIVASLELSIAPGAVRKATDKGTLSVEAYDLFLKGRDLYFRTTRSATIEAEAALRAAIAIDSSFARAYAFLSQVHLLYWLNQWGADVTVDRRLSLELVEMATRLDPNDANSYATASAIRNWRREYDEGLASAQRALIIDPTSVYAYYSLGGALLGLGRPDEALAVFEAAERLNPRDFTIRLHFRSRALFMLDRFDEAVRLLRERIARSPDTDVSRALLASVYGHLGQADDAKAVWQELHNVNPDYSLAFRREILPSAEFEKMLAGLRQAGVPLDVTSVADGPNRSHEPT